MNRVIDGLRQSPKGQLQYERKIDGKSLKKLMKKCCSAPSLSSCHTETSPLRSSFGLGPKEEDEKKELDDHSDGEKGKLDSFEQEYSPVPGNTGSGVKGRVKKSQSAAETSFRNSRIKSPSKQDQNIGSDSGCKPSEDKGVSPSNTLHNELTVAFTETLRLVKNVEDSWENRAKELMEKKQQQTISFDGKCIKGELKEKKQQQFLEHQRQLDQAQQQLLSVVEQRKRRDWQQLHTLAERKHLSREQEISQAVQRVKDSHDQCSRRQDARKKDVERLAQQLQEDKAKRDQALEAQLGELGAMVQRIESTKAQLMATLDQCPHKEHLSEAAEKVRPLARKLAEQAEVMLGGADRNGPLEDITGKLRHFQEQSQNALDFVISLTAEAEKKAKAVAAEVERQRQQQQQTTPSQQQQANPGQPPLQPGLTTPTAQQAAAPGEDRALMAVAKEYADNVKLLMQTNAVLQPFLDDQQMKKTRFDLQRAVNTPVNAISPVSSAHLRDKLMRLRLLLKGQSVDVMGKQVSAQVLPQGITFCRNLTARMIARKADEQVSSNHESAFAIAAVAVGLWAEFPDVGELLMVHLQTLCPYVLPFYPPRLPGQSSADYHRTLGYKVEEDGSIEQQDKFLRRMSGLMRLYAAIMVTGPPQGPATPHPHGLDRVWVWLTRMLNLAPNPDITATAIYDMLTVTGHFLLRAYKVQFVKLLYCLYKVFLPKLKAVAAGSGPVSRLETFLQTAMKNNAVIPEPEGYLPPRFLNF